MRDQKKIEKQIIAITCVATVAVVVGFTLMQGKVKSKDDKYVAQDTKTQSEVKLSKDSYEIIKNENLKKANQYIVLQKKELTPEAIAILVDEVVNEISEEFKIYIFEDREKATNFDGSENQIQKLVTPNGNDIQIQTYHIIENEIESIPNNYEIKSLEQSEDITNIELEIEPIDNPEKALAEVKFLGQSIRELNSDKDLSNLDIQAYHSDNRNISWNYSSENKSRIVKSEIVEG